MSIRRLPKASGNRRVLGSDLLIRSASALVLIAVALLAAYVGGVPAGVVVAIFASLIQVEWAGLTGASLSRTVPFVAIVAATILLASIGLVLPAVLIALIVALVAAAIARDSWLPTGVLYAAAFGIGLLAIRESPEYGLAALIFVLAIVAATDTGAYFCGRLIGGARLWPAVSPNKTWAGAIGGLAAAFLVGGVVAYLTEVPVTAPLLVTALVLSVFCQLGDLFESWVKRRFGAKDSGRIVPGHGGMMDRVDGLIFAATAAAFIGAARGAGAGIAQGLLLW